jgi:hypothetical protein
MTKAKMMATNLEIHSEMTMAIHLVNHLGIPKVIHLEMTMAIHLVKQKVMTKVKRTEMH